MKLALGFCVLHKFSILCNEPNLLHAKNKFVQKITKNVFDNSLTVIEINPTIVAIVILMVSCMLGSIPILNL